MNVLSFFCGPGGLDEGFRLAGHKTIAATDADASALRTYGHNHPNVRTHCLDLLTVSTNKVVEAMLADCPTDQPIGVIGGPPCQSFSESNAYQFEEDPRHGLPLKYAAILKALNKECPVSFFVFENVPGLLRPKHAKRYAHFKARFEAAGFELFEKLLDARNYEVPQQRPRVIIVGLNKLLHHSRQWEQPKISPQTKTVHDAIFDLPEPVRYVRGLTRADIPHHPNHWCMAPKSSKFGSGKLRPGKAWGRSFRMLDWHQPSWSVAYGHREVHVHPSGIRRLSVYEAMLLQSFPKSYELMGTLSSQIKQVSDAVPPLMAKAIAESIKAVR